MQRISLFIAVALGLGSVANGLFMLIAPSPWYFAIPGVTTTGPFNQHFIRDIGFIFLFIGAGFLIGASRAQYRVVLWAASTTWLAGHALFHFWEVAVGICAPAAISRDFGGVTLPAILGALITCRALVDARRASRPSEA
jgi:uncharacterized protein YjeT (DUF2065 family)